MQNTPLYDPMMTPFGFTALKPFCAKRQKTVCIICPLESYHILYLLYKVNDNFGKSKQGIPFPYATISLNILLAVICLRNKSSGAKTNPKSKFVKAYVQY